MLVVPPVLVVGVQQLAVLVPVAHRPHRPHRRAINKETVTMMADSDFAVAIRRPNRTAYRRQVSDKIVQVCLYLSLFLSLSVAALRVARHSYDSIDFNEALLSLFNLLNSLCGKSQKKSEL